MSKRRSFDELVAAAGPLATSAMAGSKAPKKAAYWTVQQFDERMKHNIAWCGPKSGWGTTWGAPDSNDVARFKTKKAAQAAWKLYPNRPGPKVEFVKVEI